MDKIKDTKKMERAPDINSFLRAQLEHFDDIGTYHGIYFNKPPSKSKICKRNTDFGISDYIIIVRYIYLFCYFKAIKKEFILLFYPLTPEYKKSYSDNIEKCIVRAMTLSEENNDAPILIPVLADEHATSCLFFKCDYGWNQIWIDSSEISGDEPAEYNIAVQKFHESFELYKQQQQSINKNPKNIKMRWSNCSKDFQQQTNSCGAMSTLFSVYFIYYLEKYKNQFCSPTRLTKFCHVFQKYNEKHFDKQFDVFTGMLYFIDNKIHNIYKISKYVKGNIDDKENDDYETDERDDDDEIKHKQSHFVVMLDLFLQDINTEKNVFFKKIIEKYNMFHALKLKNPKKFREISDKSHNINLNVLYANNSPSDNEETDPESEEEDSLWYKPKKN